jgi:hypothetical protein
MSLFLIFKVQIYKFSTIVLLSVGKISKTNHPISLL